MREPGRIAAVPSSRLARREKDGVRREEVRRSLGVSRVDRGHVLRAGLIDGLLEDGASSAVVVASTRVFRERAENVDVELRGGAAMSFAMSGGAGTASTRAHKFQHELLESGRRTHEQHPCGLRANHLEAVRDLARAVDPRPGAGVHPLAVAHEPHVPLEHVERFVLVVMGVVGRGQPGGMVDVLHQAEAAVGRLAGGVQHRGRAEELEIDVLAGLEIGLEVLRSRGLSSGGPFVSVRP